MRSILKRLLGRHTTAIAYLALFAALGGSAYAAVTVTGNNIKNGTITGKDVKNRSLGTKKLSTKAINSLKGLQGPAGPQGMAGPIGPEGPPGADGTPATKLLAYVAFDSPSTYSLGYGSGAVQVTKLPFSVDVRFNQNVHGCTAHATPGTPAGVDDDLDYSAIPSIHVDPDERVGVEDDVIRVLFRSPSGGTFINTSFFVTVFC
jgi:hypothetical protein